MYRSLVPTVSIHSPLSVLLLFTAEEEKIYDSFYMGGGGGTPCKMPATCLPAACCQPAICPLCCLLTCCCLPATRLSVSAWLLFWLCCWLSASLPAAYLLSAYHPVCLLALCMFPVCACAFCFLPSRQCCGSGSGKSVINPCYPCLCNVKSYKVKKEIYKSPLEEKCT